MSSYMIHDEEAIGEKNTAIKPKPVAEQGDTPCRFQK